MNLLFLFHRGNLLPPFLLFLCLRSWNSPGNRTNKARQIVPSLVNPAEALSFSQFVSLIEELGSGNQVTAASVNGVFTVTGRSVNLQDCSCSRIVPPHILKNRRVSRRDTRLVSRSLLLYIYIYIYSFSFFFPSFLPLSPSLRFPSSSRREDRISTATSSTDSPTTELLSLFLRLEYYRDGLPGNFSNLRAAKRPIRMFATLFVTREREKKEKV